MEAYEVGESPKQYAIKNNNSPSGIYKALKKIKTNVLVEYMPRSGRPSKLTPAVEEYINHAYANNNKITSKAL